MRSYADTYIGENTWTTSVRSKCKLKKEEEEEEEEVTSTRNGNPYKSFTNTLRTIISKNFEKYLKLTTDGNSPNLWVTVCEEVSPWRLIETSFKRIAIAD